MWRAFFGMWDDGDPEWTHLDERGLAWEQARDRIRGLLERFRDDDCTYCQGDALDELAKLAAAEPGTEWRGEVEGEDYLIVADPGLVNGRVG